MADSGTSQRRRKASTARGEGKASSKKDSSAKRLDRIEAAVRHLLGGDASRFLGEE